VNDDDDNDDDDDDDDEEFAKPIAPLDRCCGPGSFWQMTPCIWPSHFEPSAACLDPIRGVELHVYCRSVN